MTPQIVVKIRTEKPPWLLNRWMSRLASGFSIKRIRSLNHRLSTFSLIHEVIFQKEELLNLRLKYF